MMETDMFAAGSLRAQRGQGQPNSCRKALPIPFTTRE
jgi:hypothetical protein